MGNAWIDVFSSFGLGVVVAIAVVALLLKHYLPAYLNEKGKNLATREDIASITREVERVRSEYGALLEELKARNQLRIAAIDRRLQAHQEAFTLWFELIAGSKERGDAVIACQKWWSKNCVYLEPSVRQAFIVFYNSAQLQSALVRVGAKSNEILEEWNKVMAFPNVLFAAIQLPVLTELEFKTLEQSVENKTHE